jgi:hypothetical protein
MTVRESRDPVFWRNVQSDPIVNFAFSRSGFEIDLAVLVSSEYVRPFTGEHGGFIAVEMLPGSHRFWDIHAAFTADRTRAETHDVGERMVDTLFKEGAVLLQLTQRTDELSHRPPQTQGWFKGSGEEQMRGRPYHAISWLLTREMWYASPVFRRISK